MNHKLMAIFPNENETGHDLDARAMICYTTDNDSSSLHHLSSYLSGAAHSKMEIWQQPQALLDSIAAFTKGRPERTDQSEED